MKCDLIVPSTPQDICLLKNYLDWYFNYLPIKRIIIIGPSTTQHIIPIDTRVSFIDEDRIVSYAHICHLLEKRSNNELTKKRTGWYLQQFLKMAYARICEDDYYLLWDSDTLPLKKIELFDMDGKPYLDYKTEYYKQYFDTLECILPGYRKIFKGSFISEHMLINKKHMCELLKKIEGNTEIPGTMFYEKIINAIDINHLAGSGFSEFETIGSFVYQKYKNLYTVRPWKSMRHGGFFFSKSEMISDTSRFWLAKKFHAITFEKNDDLCFWSKMINTKLFMSLFPPLALNMLSIIPRLKRKFKYEKR